MFESFWFLVSGRGLVFNRVEHVERVDIWWFGRVEYFIQR